MPGPYAHITLLHELMQQQRLKSIFSPSSGFPAILETYFPFCTLGAVSPDYPNLERRDKSAYLWADAMHCSRACEMISSGIRRVKTAEDSAARYKQVAWLLGYSAHVATDLTIHPIVQAKVGVYAENQRQHRICEMNQDSHIYRRMNQGEIGDSDNFAFGVLKCGTSEDITQLDSDIAALWEAMLEDVHPQLFSIHPPECRSWHTAFMAMNARSAADTKRLFPLAKVIATKMGLAYPLYDAVDQQYVAEQVVPSETPLVLHYDRIFDLAVENVASIWNNVEQAICTDDPISQPAFGDWNLDNGCDEHGKLVFW